MKKSKFKIGAKKFSFLCTFKENMSGVPTYCLNLENASSIIAAFLRHLFY